MTPTGSPMQTELVLKPKPGARIADLDALVPSTVGDEKDDQPEASPLDKNKKRHKGHTFAKKFTCRICGKTESSPIAVFHHMKKEHPGQKKPEGKEEKVVERTGASKAKPKAVAKPKKRRSVPMKAKLTEAQKQANKLAYMQEYHRRRKEKGGKPLGQRKGKGKPGRKPGSGPIQKAMEIHTNGNLPMPFRYCNSCGEKLPTKEFKGRELPAAFPFCGFCGFKLPTVGG